MNYCVTQVFVLVIATYVCYVLGCPLCEPGAEVREACYPLKKLQHCIPKPSTGSSLNSFDCACQWKTFIDNISLESLNTVSSGRTCYVWARDGCTDSGDGKQTRESKQRPRSVPNYHNDQSEITDEDETLDEAILAAQRLRVQIGLVKDPVEKHDISEKLIKLMKKISTLQQNIGKNTGNSEPGFIIERQQNDNFVGRVPFAQVLVDTDETDQEKEDREKRESIEDVKFKLTIFVGILLFNIIIFIFAILLRCDRKRKGVATRTVGDLDPKRNIKFPVEDHMSRTSLDNFLDKLRGHMRQKAVENSRKGSVASSKYKPDHNSVSTPLIVHRHVSTEFDDSPEEADDDVFQDEARTATFHKTDDSFEVAEINIPNEIRQKPRSVSWLDYHEPTCPATSSVLSRIRRDRPSQTSQASTQPDPALLTMLN